MKQQPPLHSQKGWMPLEAKALQWAERFILCGLLHVPVISGGARQEYMGVNLHFINALLPFLHRPISPKAPLRIHELTDSFVLLVGSRLKAENPREQSRWGSRTQTCSFLTIPRPVSRCTPPSAAPRASALCLGKGKARLVESL